MAAYKKIFDSGLGEQEVNFENLVVEVTDENKDVVVPMLVTLAQREDQKAKLKEVCERIKFDLSALEAGTNPSPKNKSIN